MINRIVIKIYQIKQINTTLMLYIKAGTFIYIYYNSFCSKNASCEHAMLKNGASVEISW